MAPPALVFCSSFPSLLQSSCFSFLSPSLSSSLSHFISPSLKPLTTTANNTQRTHNERARESSSSISFFGCLIGKRRRDVEAVCCFSLHFRIYSCYKALLAAGFSDCGYVSGYNISGVFLSFFFRPLRASGTGGVLLQRGIIMPFSLVGFPLFSVRVLRACVGGFWVGGLVWPGPARLPSCQAVSPPMFCSFDFLFLCGLFGVKFRLGGLISHEFGGGGRPN